MCGCRGGRGLGGSKCEGGDELTILHVTEWMCKRLGSSMGAKAATSPWTWEMVGPNHPPVDACILKSPHPTIYTLRWLLQLFRWKQLHTKA